MSTFEITATIYIKDVQTSQEAIVALQNAIDSYEELNPNQATIVIHHDIPVETDEVIN